MKESGWGFGLVSLGLVVLAILFLAQRYSNANEEDFYIGKEVLTSSMLEAIDLASYRSSGKLVMSEQKFIEIFIRRFAESVSANKSYKLDFYDIREFPPKASVRIRTNAGATEVGDDSFDPTVDTLLSGVLETVIPTNDSANASAGYYDMDKLDNFKRSDY